MMEKIKIVLKAKENPAEAALRQGEREVAAAVIRKGDTVNPTGQEVQAV